MKRKAKTHRLPLPPLFAEEPWPLEREALPLPLLAKRTALRTLRTSSPSFSLRAFLPDPSILDKIANEAFCSSATDRSVGSNFFFFKKKVEEID